MHRLKDKLGTRMLPTAEVKLDGAVATPVTGLSDGVRAIAPMLQITRTWNALCAVCSMRRGVALARDYAGRRSAFGARLADKPLHVQTLAELEAEYQAAFLLTFRLLELLGRVEAGEATDWERRLLRILQPIAKLLTGKQAVAHASEVLEAFGGAGYVEDTGLPALLRDAQVLPIWEGTTNVLSLDLLRALSGESGLFDVDGELSRALGAATDAALLPVRDRARALIDAAGGWFSVAQQGSPAEMEGGARRFAMAVGRVAPARARRRARSVAARARRSERPGRRPSAGGAQPGAGRLVVPWPRTRRAAGLAGGVARRGCRRAGAAARRDLRAPARMVGADHAFGS